MTRFSYAVYLIKHLAFLIIYIISFTITRKIVVVLDNAPEHRAKRLLALHEL